MITESERHPAGADPRPWPVPLACPDHRQPLGRDDSQTQDALRCPSGCRFTIIGDVPRFVASDDYAAGFGLQWNTFRTVQLDSTTGLSISRDRLTRLFGGTLDGVSGATVLEVGCGAGRFTEILLERGAIVVATDLSSAVDANRKNCGHHPNHFACQADVLRLPFSPRQFDFVVGVGFIQATPSPERTIQALCEHVKPGGRIVIDHYGLDYPTNLSRRVLRSLLRRLPTRPAMAVNNAVVSMLWPIHRGLWASRPIRGLGRLSNLWLRISPVVDYHRAYPELGPALLLQWAKLDTHDTLTDRYKHLRSSDQITGALRLCGMEAIESEEAGNGVEARARRPSE